MTIDCKSEILKFPIILQAELETGLDHTVDNGGIDVPATQVVSRDMAAELHLPATDLQFFGSGLISVAR